MKRIMILLLTLATLAACQPTPEQDAVRQKNSEKMIEMAIGEDTVAPKEADEQPSATPVPVREQIPERLVWDFYTDVENIHVTADAPICIMTEDVFPLLRVEPRRFKASDNLAVVQALLGTDTVYKSVYQLTRKDLEKQISDLMNTLSDPYNNEELLEDFGREELDELIPRWQKNLEDLQEQYRNFQDDDPIPNPVWDGLAEPDMHQTVLVKGPWDRDALKCDSVYFFARDEYPTYWSVDMAREGEWGAAWDYGLMERIDPADYDTPHAGTTMTPNEAVQMLQSVLSPFVKTRVVDILWSNNASDTYGSDGTKLHWGYVIRLLPAYHGTATGMGLGYLPMSSRDPITDVCRQWEQEYIMGAVNEDGVRKLEWRSPLTVTEVVTENATLLPFSEIETIARRQINRLHSYRGFRGEEAGTLEVAGVRLGLLYIMEQNVLEGGLLVPVWYFLQADEPNERQKELWSDGIETWNYDTWNPLVVINAVDGTIIDPYAGY